jgi:hypothetical protein
MGRAGRSEVRRMLRAAGAPAAPAPQKASFEAISAM